MPELILHLDLPPQQLHAYYRGEVRVVRARAATGQMVQFPASALQKHFATDGVRGRFRMEFDANHKFVALERVPEPAPEPGEERSGEEGLRPDGFPRVMRA